MKVTKIKISKSLLLFGNILLTLLILSVLSGVHAETIFRVNNPNSGEHLYTTSSAEVQNLVCGGWVDEGINWISPDSGEGVYRLYSSANGGDHLYTKDTNEVNVLTSQSGWQVDNNGQPLFNSGGDLPVYRLLNSQTGRHHLTTDVNEYNALPAQGWQQEGVSLNCAENAANYLSPALIRSRIMDLQASYPEGMPWDNNNQYVSNIQLQSTDDDGWSVTTILSGAGCHAFGLICSDTAFGELPARIHNNKNDIKVGDVLRINGNTHTVVALDVCGDSITITEGNWGSQIHWGRTISRANTDILYIMTRYPGYNEPSNPDLLYYS